MKPAPQNQTPLRFGEVPAGWEPRRWAEHLRGLADACRAYDRERADEYDKWAKRIDDARA